MTTGRRTLTVALAGFGTVGQAVARLLVERGAPALQLRTICTRRAPERRGAAAWVPADVTWTPRLDDVLAGGADVVVELIGGLEPARTVIASALASGRAVVTANKQVLATHGPGLVALARARGVPLRFEAAVAGVTPVLRGIQAGLAADEISCVAGILNGTSNFVLTRMERDRVPLADAVADAQRLGYAEADPAADLDGLDARAKLVILAAIGLGRYVPPDDVPAESIRGLETADLDDAVTLGRAVRQVAWAERTPGRGGHVAARVSPALVPRDSWLARAEGPRNVVLVRGSLSGDTVFVGEGAGGNATAVAVVSDLLAIAHAPGAPRPWPSADASGVATAGGARRSDLVAPHYVRIAAAHASEGRPDPRAVLAGHGLHVQTLCATSPAAGVRRWAGVVAPCGQAALDAALTAYTSNGGAGSAVVRLPLIDVG